MAVKAVMVAGGSKTTLVRRKVEVEEGRGRQALPSPPEDVSELIFRSVYSNSQPFIIRNPCQLESIIWDLLLISLVIVVECNFLLNM